MTMENAEPIPRYKYPKCVIFLLLFEFCERFCFHEIFSIIAVYLTSYLQLTETFTITYYHALLTLTYLFPSFGSVLSYSFLGKFKLVAYASCIYIIAVLLLLLATIPPLNLPQVPLSLSSLVLITVTAGTLKPCIPLIGGDQFVLPEQQDQLSNYFSAFNLVIVVSALAGKMVAPFLREHVHCFGENSCFSVVFGISFVLIITATVIFCLGGRYYKVFNCEDNIVTAHVNWILETLKIKRHTTATEKPPPAKPIHQIKTLLRIWLTILPFIVLSGASDIRCSLMFFQAMRMDGNIGFYDILPDQFAIIEAIITLPIFALVSCVVFPCCRRRGFMRKTLHKVVFGGGLVGVSLLGAGVLSVIMEKNYPVLPVAGQGQISLYNTLPCDVVVDSERLGLQDGGVVVVSGGVLNRIARVRTCEDVPYTITSACFNASGALKMCEQENFSYFFENYNLVGLGDGGGGNHTKGAARFRTFVNSNENSSEVNLKSKNGNWEFSSSSKFRDIPLGLYSTTIGNFTHNFNVTENDYTLMVIARNDSHMEFSMSEKMKPDRLEMLWMMPHRLLNCLGEMIATSAVLEFCYSEAPANIKNVAVAGYYLMISAGNVVIIAVEAICPFQELSYKFFLYAGLLLLDLIVLAFLTKNYKRAEEEK